MNLKVLLMVGIIIVVTIIVIVGGIVLFGDGEKVDVVNDFKDIQESTQGNIYTESESQKVYDPSKREGLANPRVTITNSSGDEVIGLDHNGTISGVNLEIDENATITGSGFFDFLGSIASRITGFWGTDANFSGSLKTPNITTTQYCNATACYTLEQLILGGSGMDYTNVALTNISEVFDEDVNITGNLSIGSGTQYMGVNYNGSINFFNTLGNNAFFLDNLTANYFFGDGSLLSNLPSGDGVGQNSTWEGNLSAQNNCPTGNYSYGMLSNGSLLCRSDIDIDTDTINSTSEMFGAIDNNTFVKFDTDNTGQVNISGQVALTNVRVCWDTGCTTWSNATGRYWNNGASYHIFNGSGVLTKGN